MDLLRRVGQELIDIENGRTWPPSPEGIEYSRYVLREADECPEAIEECGRDLVAYVLTFQDQGLSMEAAVQTWAEENPWLTP